VTWKIEIWIGEYSYSSPFTKEGCEAAKKWLDQFSNEVEDDEVS